MRSSSHSIVIRNGSLEGILVRVLFAAKLWFPKILVPRLPKHTSNVNIASTGNSKQRYYLCGQLLGALIYPHFLVLILIWFWFIMVVVNYAINGCSSSRATLGALHWRKNILAVITQHRVIDGNLKRQTKNQALHTCRLFLLTWIFQYIINWAKAF